MNDLNALLGPVSAIAVDAGAAILEIYNRGDVDVDHKDDNSPITEADRAAHNLIEARLQALTPEIPVFSEESGGIAYEDRKDWPRFWLVDPLDGTKEFIKRNGEFTVNIALVRHGRVAGGVVFAPVLGHAYLGVVGEGAWRLDVSAGTDVDAALNTQVSLPLDAGKRAFTVVASRSHMSPETQAYVEEAKAIHEKKVSTLEKNLEQLLATRRDAQKRWEEEKQFGN